MGGKKSTYLAGRDKSQNPWEQYARGDGKNRGKKGGLPYLKVIRERNMERYFYENDWDRDKKIEERKEEIVKYLQDKGLELEKSDISQCAKASVETGTGIEVLLPLIPIMKAINTEIIIKHRKFEAFSLAKLHEVVSTGKESLEKGGIEKYIESLQETAIMLEDEIKGKKSLGEQIGNELGKLSQCIKKIVILKTLKNKFEEVPEIRKILSN